MSVFEAPLSTWDKRFKQRHYSYRDSHAFATTVLTALQELGLLAAGSPTVLYNFGTNARLISIFNWPNVGDYASGTLVPRGQCYAREVMVYVTEATWIRFISLNPAYPILLTQGYSTGQIAAMGVSQVITEVEHFVARRDKDTFYPTYASAIVFRADTVAGTIYISAEGNVEGGE